MPVSCYPRVRALHETVLDEQSIRWCGVLPAPDLAVEYQTHLMCMSFDAEQPWKCALRLKPECRSSEFIQQMGVDFLLHVEQDEYLSETQNLRNCSPQMQAELLALSVRSNKEEHPPPKDRHERMGYEQVTDLLAVDNPHDFDLLSGITMPIRNTKDLAAKLSLWRIPSLSGDREFVKLCLRADASNFDQISFGLQRDPEILALYYEYG